jgi:AraC family transcriptional activator of mtrCDE
MDQGLGMADPIGMEVCRFASQWDTVHEAEPPGWAQFHIVTKGCCLLERYGGEPLRLEAGNLLLLPHGDAHVVRSARRGGSSGMPVRIEYNNALRIKTNTRDESDTELICGALRCGPGQLGHRRPAKNDCAEPWPGEATRPHADAGADDR